MTAANNLLKTFCESIGMVGMGLDEEQQRSLSFDEKTIVTFIGDNDQGLTALCYVGDVHTPEQMTFFLSQNFLAERHGGARYALEPESNRMILTTRWDAVKVDVPTFSSQLEALVNSAMGAQAYIESGSIPGNALPTSAAAPAKDAPAVDSLASAYQAL